MNYMALSRDHYIMEPLFGGNTKMALLKDMLQVRVNLDTKPLGNSNSINYTGLEMIERQVERYFKDNSQKVKKKVSHVQSLKMAQSIMESTRMISTGEMEYLKAEENYINLNLKMAILSAKQNTNL